ncbi:TetR/AcrR family transcriptional regulator [Rothia sp. LK2588]|uniref:TetR/AcrR family transcriptional regulator n=1 Tax=Rothia sp. LK2588 TaxID=3114369 RepID=UPI0034CDABD9
MTAPEAAPTAKRGRPGYERDELLRICVRAFNEHGYEATSMGTLASTLGITKSAIYHHVSSKEEILEYALDHALDALEEVFEGAESLDVSAEERLEFAIRQTIFVLIEHFDNVTLLLRLRGNSEMEKRALDRRRQLTAQLGAFVEAAQREGSVRDTINPKNAARLVFGMINSLAEWYRPDGVTDVDALAEAIVKMAFDGLRS